MLTEGIDIDSFFQKVSETPNRLLMLDYDGTLAPFHVDRNKAFPYIEVNELLDRLLLSTTTHIAVISGRSISDLLPLLKLNRLPEIWGSHGWEHITSDGKREIPSLGDNAILALRQGLSSIETLGLAEKIEEKPTSIAVHWRGFQDDQIVQIRNNVMQAWTPIEKKYNVEIHPFDGGLELRVKGRNKGFSVTKILSEMPTGTIAAYLGDDLTDEDAFNALKGKGIGFLVREEFRATAADIWLHPPEELLVFLERWLDACLQIKN